jgi:hypothetical protein
MSESISAREYVMLGRCINTNSHASTRAKGKKRCRNFFGNMIFNWGEKFCVVRFTYVPELWFAEVCTVL